VLRRLDGAIERLMRESDAPLRVSLFSDHGNHFRGYERVSFSGPLRRAGLRLAKRVDGPSDVVVPSYGLVGAAVLFTTEANEPRAARAVATAEGVDFAVYERDGVARIVSRDGLATIERRGDRYRYVAAKGDPLGLLPVLPGVIERADADGFVADADWFEATRALARPDAVRRVYDGATGHVRNRANVVVSLEDGYLAGSAAMDLFAAMRATHGSLAAEQSSGFVMTTASGLPPVLRAGDVWRALGSPDL
jgi:hypothetical protein